MIDSPEELYTILGHEVIVKREDCCVNDDENQPPFSKVRGLYSRIQNLIELGYTHFGYTESAVSMAGWGVAYVCAKLGVQAVIYDPQYVREDFRGAEILTLHRKMWDKFGAIVNPIKASMVKVNYNICKKHLESTYSNAIMLPLGLPFEDSIEATREQLDTIQNLYNSIVVCVGSGTITAGLLRGEKEKPIYGVMSRTGNKELMHKKILKKSGCILFTGENLKIIDEGWHYTEKSNWECPFPSHPYYDLKAWEWLVNNINKIPKPVLFWNIGRKI